MPPPSSWMGSTFAALSVPNFRWFFIGQGLSQTGTWMRRTALGWLVFELTGSYKLLGTVMALSLAPMFFLAPLSGAIADRVDKRKMIIFSQLMASATSAALAAYVFLDFQQIWPIMVMAIFAGIAFSIEVPPRQAFVVEMVGREHLMNAIALNSALVNMTRIVGPAAAGILMSVKGAGFVFLIDCVSYLCVAGTLMALKLPKFVKPKDKPSRIKQVVDGLKEACSNEHVRPTLMLLFTTACFGWSFTTLMPAICQDVVKMSELKYGVLMSSFGIGAIAGALLVAGMGTRTNPRRQLFGGIWLMIAGLIVFSFMRSFWTMAPAMIVVGFGAIAFISTANTIVQTSVQDRIRGRVMGVWALTFGGSLPLGSYLTGWVSSYISPFQTIQIFCSITIVTSISIFLWFSRGIGSKLIVIEQDSAGDTSDSKESGPQQPLPTAPSILERPSDSTPILELPAKQA